MDTNGVLYYLGTSGGKRLYQNPGVLGQVNAFASSVGCGNIVDFVGRSVTNLRTYSEPFSYFGVDIGPGRKFLPSAYTIINRNASTHVCLNWRFEGSNDKVNWKVLDERHINSQNGDDESSFVID